MVTAQTEKKVKFLFNLLPLVGALCVLVAMGMAIYRAQFDEVSYALMGIGFLLFLTLFLKAEVSNLKYYLHLMIYSVMVGAICVVGYLFANRYTHKLDLSEQKLYSLSEASSKYLKGLTDEVTITAFTPTPDPFDTIRKLYSSDTDKIKWVFKDALKEPLEARKLGEDVRNGEVFIASGDNKKRMTAQEIMTADYENVLTNAIVDVTRKDRPKMYFIEGHGEVPFAQAAPAQGARQQEPLPTVQGFRELMAQRGIQSATLDLAKEGKVPDDASLLVLAGPRSDLYSPEAHALEAYLDNGGKLLALVDAAASRSSGELPNLETTLEKYGLSFPNSIVLDMVGAQFVGSPEQPLMSSFDPTHAITRDLSKRPSRSMLGITRPILATSQGGMQATTLVKSSPQSWSADLAQLMAANGQISPPSENELAAQPLGVAISKGTPPQMPMGMPSPPEDKGGMRLVVYGSSQLIRDDFLSTNQVGIELMLNSVNWLSQREDMIAVPSKQVKGTPIILDAAKLRVIFVFSVVLIPALLFFGGVTYSVVRRRT